MLYGWKEKISMLTNCLAACAHITITVSEIERDIGQKSSIFHTKSSIFHTPFYSTPPLGGFLLEYRHPVWYGKTRGQSNLTKSASRGPIARLGVTPGVESCTIEFLG